MRARGTFALAAAFGALCLAYWLVQAREEQQIAEKIEAKRVFDFDASAVTAIEIQRIGEEASAAMLGENEKWSFTKPHEDIKANQIVWPRVANAIALLQNERTIAESQPADLQQYGLADPALTIFATTHDGELRLDFGEVEPTQTYRYAMLDEQTVFLVNNKEHYFELNRPLDDLRDRFLVDNREANIMRIEFARIFTGSENAGLEDPPHPAPNPRRSPSSAAIPKPLGE